MTPGVVAPRRIGGDTGSGVNGTQPASKQLRAYAHPSTGRALATTGLDIALYLVGAGAALGDHPGVGLLGSAIMTVAMVRLFILGHDACHQSLTAFRRLNGIIGRVAFLPTLTPFATWEFGHNVMHHGFTNLRGRDRVWVPMDVRDYRSAVSLRRLQERTYRTLPGVGVYYLVELWWKQLWLGTLLSWRGCQSKRVWWDMMLTIAWLGLWLGAVASAGSRGGHPHNDFLAGLRSHRSSLGTGRWGS
ncbi:MAG: fatty acid desaturase [Betaproteobacteria bacterium]|nr:fatty acid desaturase [Betaproteobacteria bacterium]